MLFVADFKSKSCIHFPQHARSVIQWEEKQHFFFFLHSCSSMVVQCDTHKNIAIIEIFPAFSFLLGEICIDRKHTPCMKLPVAFKPACGLMRHTANDWNVHVWCKNIFFSSLQCDISLKGKNTINKILEETPCLYRVFIKTQWNFWVVLTGTKLRVIEYAPDWPITFELV